MAPYLAAGGGASVAYLALPNGGLAEAALFVSASLTVPAAMFVGIRLHRPALPRAWLILTAGWVMHGAATVLWYLTPLNTAQARPFPSILDGLYLFSHALLLAGLTVLIRSRGRHDRGGILDALLITLGAAVFSWVFVIHPYVVIPETSDLARLVAVAYPLVDLMLVGLVARLALVPGARTPSLWFLTLSLVAQTVADTAYAVTSSRGTFAFGSVIFLGWLAHYSLMGCAALHPSMRHVADPPAHRVRVRMTWRLVLLGEGCDLTQAVSGISPERQR